MMNLAMFGGSFNPVHIGHVELLKRMIETFSLDKVLVIPTNVTPLKDNSFMASPSDRLSMCRLAFCDIDAIEVSDLEIERKGKSYTADTLKQIKAMYPHSKLHLIVGADAFLQLELWHKAPEIFVEAKIITIARDDKDATLLAKTGEKYRNAFNAEYGIIETPVTNISSTEIRNRIQNKKSVEGLVPESVYQFIKENEIYGFKNQSSL
ncbi:MAG: nicotinate (nicotinamide) nucleotide adenylyltransferase [Eubacteriales bacterium]|nr:nicotinate (nicotinamide) nucleotide adenylyltransferase [Eubacteriales bacterium]